MIALFDETANKKYFVTDKGKVFAIHTNGFTNNKKCTVHIRGYVYVRTANKNFQLHRLVATAFLPNPHKKPCVNHKDGNKANNNLNNLEWVTFKENSQHAIKNGFVKLLKKNEGGRLKYSNEICLDVLERIRSGMTYKRAGGKYLMPYSTVAHLLRGSRRLITCK